jgi:hypothetical protein
MKYMLFSGLITGHISVRLAADGEIDSQVKEHKSLVM